MDSRKESTSLAAKSIKAVYDTEKENGKNYWKKVKVQNITKYLFPYQCRYNSDEKLYAVSQI